MKTKLSFLGIVVGSLVAFTAVGDPSSPQISGNSERDSEDQKLAVIIGRVFAEGRWLSVGQSYALASFQGRTSPGSAPDRQGR